VTPISRATSASRKALREQLLDDLVTLRGQSPREPRMFDRLSTDLLEVVEDLLLRLCDFLHPTTMTTHGCQCQPWVVSIGEIEPRLPQPWIM